MLFTLAEDLYTTEELFWVVNPLWLRRLTPAKLKLIANQNTSNLYDEEAKQLELHYRNTGLLMKARLKLIIFLIIY